MLFRTSGSFFGTGCMVSLQKTGRTTNEKMVDRTHCLNGYAIPFVYFALLEDLQDRHVTRLCRFTHWMFTLLAFIG